MKNRFICLVAFSALALSSASMAATWGLTGGGYAGDIYLTNAPTSGSGAAVQIRAYANTGGSDATVSAANQTIQLQNRTYQSTINGYTGIVDWGSAYGLGIVGIDGCGFTTNTSSTNTALCDANEGGVPEHAVDNNQRNEMALMQFGQKANLTSFSIGWNGSDNQGTSNTTNRDSDMTLIAYTGGSGNPFADGALVGKTWSQLIASGWTLVGNYADVGLNSGAYNGTVAVSTTVSSSYWMVGTYNKLIQNTGWTAYDDAVKLTSVSATLTNQVPEPGSLALVGLAGIAMVALGRRRKVIRA